MTANGSQARAPGADALYRAHARPLFGLAYRLTGSAADADEVVQETFLRALASPPARTEDPWAPWLVRVATNLAIDVVRRRRRRGGDVSWLPAAVADDELDALPEPRERAPDLRYEVLESATFAFLIALEALTPRQRAAFVLREVCGYSAGATAAFLGASEASVRVLHHRARRAFAAYDAAPCRPSAALVARHRDALEALVKCLVAQDVSALTALLRADVTTTTDSGGEFNALRGVRRGRMGVARFHLRVARNRGAGARITPCLANGLPALAITFARAGSRQARRVLMRCELDASGRIAAIHSLLATRKLTRVAFAP